MLPVPLTRLLDDLADHGIALSYGSSRDTLRASPADRLDDDLRERIKAWKTQLLDVLSVQDFDVSDRAEIMAGTRYNVVISGLPYRRGWCFSCWAVLPDGVPVGRCPACSDALRRALAQPSRLVS